MPTFGTTNKQYVSTLMVPNLIDRREIMKMILNVTNEDISFVEFMELLGRSVVTASPEYHNFINEELSVNVTATAVDDSTYSVSRPLVTVSSGDFAKVREGELVICPNGQVGLIVAKASYGSVTLSANQFELKSVNGNSLALAASDKLSVFSNAAGEGSGAPSNRRYGISKETNHIQIFKESYKVTDIEMGNQVEFEYNGVPSYFLYEQAQVYQKFLQAVSAGLLFGRQSTDTFNDSSATLVDKSGNTVSTTKGLNEYAEEGISFAGTGVDTTVYSDIARALARTRAPMDYLILGGVETCILHDNMLNALTATEAFSPFAQIEGPQGEALSLGVKSFKIYGFNFTIKRLPFIDHQTLVNFTGSAGYHKKAWFVPMDNIRTVDGGSVPRLQIRYMQAPSGPDLRYREFQLGGLASTPTSADSVLEFVYESRQGLQVLGKQHFMVLDLEA